jgi:hypothetical protein
MTMTAATTTAPATTILLARHRLADTAWLEPTLSGPVHAVALRMLSLNGSGATLLARHRHYWTMLGGYAPSSVEKTADRLVAEEVRRVIALGFRGARSIALGLAVAQSPKGRMGSIWTPEAVASLGDLGEDIQAALGARESYPHDDVVLLGDGRLARWIEERRGWRVDATHPSFEGSGMVFTSSEDDHVGRFTLARFKELNADDPMLRVWSDQLRALEPGDEVEIAWFTFRRVHLDTGPRGHAAGGDVAR